MSDKERTARMIARKVAALRSYDPADHHGMAWMEQKFWHLVSPAEDESGCWLWAGAKDRDGYGRMHHSRKKLSAHRISYELFVGPIPNGLHVLHSCDNPPCVNPAHLHTGTHQENMRERNARGRTASGEANGRAKISLHQLKAIRDLKQRCGYSTRDIGDVFGIHPETVQDALNGVNWKKAQ